MQYGFYQMSTCLSPGKHYFIHSHIFPTFHHWTENDGNFWGREFSYNVNQQIVLVRYVKIVLENDHGES